MRLEAKVGLFVAFGFVLLLALSTQLNSIRTVGHEVYTLRVMVEDATGLKEQARVQMNGVEVGRVENIMLSKGRVVLVLALYTSVEVPVDSQLSLVQESMLGNKIVSIKAGSQTLYFKPDETITNTSKLSSFDETSEAIAQAAKKFDTLMDSANNVLDQRRQDELKATIDDLAVTMRDIRELIQENKELVNSTLRHYDELALEFRKTGKELNSWVPTFEQKANDLVDTYSQAGDDLKQLITTNSKPLNDTIVSTGDFFDDSRKVIKRLDQFISSLTDSQLELGVYDRYLINDNSHKIIAGLTYRPEPSTSYMVEVVSDDDFTKDRDGNISVGSYVYVPPIRHELGNYWFTIMYGKRFSDMQFRIGLQENRGSVGMDYYAFNDRWRFSVDAYDFGSKNDWRSQTMRINLTARYTYLDHMDFYFGMDNILNFSNSYLADVDGDASTTTDTVTKVGNYNFMLGIGIHFIDEHLKTLLSFTGLPSAQ
ncbi:MAG: hypothetical protein KU37_08250 [Sulfuricurvum sp. PC08-66]|nr:MAG: hypothetical protein KU37_08250 [Sulfuricurvum sp. PC08-66]